MRRIRFGLHFRRKRCGAGEKQQSIMKWALIHYATFAYDLENLGLWAWFCDCYVRERGIFVVKTADRGSQTVDWEVFMLFQIYLKTFSRTLEFAIMKIYSDVVWITDDILFRSYSLNLFKKSELNNWKEFKR